MNKVNPEPVIACSRSNCSIAPVKTARYMIEVVMNEDDPNASDEQMKEAFANEFQRALDNGFFEEIRYDALNFEVVSREVLDEAPANEQRVL